MKEENGYLFVTFSGESKHGEEIYFSISRDGLHWKDLNKNKSVLQSKIGQRGVRDPFVFKMREKYYLIATDLCIASGVSWEDAAKKGSHFIIVWESEDLIHWSKERKCKIGFEGVGCVWAPEVIYDPLKDAGMIFWSSYVDGKYNIYRAYTKDFLSFSAAELYMELDYDVIDMTIFKENDRFYRFYKNEEDKILCVDSGSELNGTFEKISSEFLQRLKGVEGPIVFGLKNQKICLMVDQFQINGGYLPMVCENLEKGMFYRLKPDEYSLGVTCKRHGSILTISNEEYLRLESYYGGE